MCNVHLFVIIWMHSPIGHDGNNWNKTAPPIWIYLKMELKRLGQSQVEACCLPNQPWLPFEWEEAAQNFKRRQTSSLMWFCHHAHINNNTEPNQQPKPKTKVKINNQNQRNNNKNNTKHQHPNIKPRQLPKIQPPMQLCEGNEQTRTNLEIDYVIEQHLKYDTIHI